MLTIISFLFSLIGSINWLMIGLFQYDFIAGLFGFQASIFSRFFYILFGFSAFILIFKLIKGKGSIAVFSRKNKENLQKNIENMKDKISHSPVQNVEANKDQLDENYNNTENDQNYHQNFENHYRK